jgi:hypothetical protein
MLGSVNYFSMMGKNSDFQTTCATIQQDDRPTTKESRSGSMVQQQETQTATYAIKQELRWLH